LHDCVYFQGQRTEVGDRRMTTLRALLIMIFGFGLASVSATTASAFCGTLTRTASGASQGEALTRANNSGLIAVRQLNQQHGKRIKYETATSNCTGKNPVRCTITQGYCVSKNPVAVDTCPGDSVRNKNGKCVKEDEPVQASPCSGGRLYSLSRKICHCPYDSPVWTGQRCISGKAVSGHSNSQIIQRCRLLAQECKQDLQGACRALKTYCDRG